ncbi:MAG: hypothetical protein Kow0092_27000 [Deferrisomatales bacterium]
MSRWLRLSSLVIPVLLGAVVPRPAAAVRVSGHSGTVVEWFDEPQGDLALPVYEYLRLDLRDLGRDGVDFAAYGRLSGDPTGETEAESRLYYAYVEKKDLFGRLDARFGRQFVTTVAGASVLDGIDLKLEDLGPLAVRAFGGGDVAYDEDYEAGDLLWGLEVSGRAAGSLDWEASYLQKWDDGELARELVGLGGNWGAGDALDLYGELQFNYLADAVSYFLGGLTYHPSLRWSVRGEYLYSLPVFDSTSIYSVFAVEEYRELLGEVVYRLRPGLRVFGRYTHEFYAEFADADVYEVGVEQVRTGRFSGYLVGTFRDDEGGQDLRGVKARAAFRFTPRLQLGAGAHVDVLERDLADDDDTTSGRYWADATAYLTRTVDLQVKVERVESGLYDFYYRGRVRLDVRF